MEIFKKIMMFIFNSIMGIIVCFLCYKEVGYLFRIKNIVVNENQNTNTLKMSFLNESKLIKEIKIDK